MNRKNRPGIKIVPLLFLYMLMTGCAGADIREEGDNDPLKGMNNVFYGINDVLDKGFLEPVAELYESYLPSSVQIGISNFFDNLAYPGVIINSVLQGRIGDGVEGTGRFVVNTVFGIAGLFDPATPLGFERHEEDFGQTLGVWGAGEGAYLVLPAVGPNSVRDAPGLVADLFTNLLYCVESSVMIPLIALNAIERRAGFLQVTRLRDASPLDPYLFTREAYRQRRTHLIHNGHASYDYGEDEEENERL
uniref:Phospholipid-binding lipoprotein MlaA n=1 Tax=Candidatus Kentrum sp. SD TaxID=2126332 RepID=A0A450Y696_9GAMM|nr:MAG: phospholipid-binding lipoprotein MlaA [Candidatus Kentron sp. SD]VFK49907.1 MAG: phospholipid-binding lipoprotein MlaA [Candidatus Kentron sp. SD]VFK77743.1 MAG: phospholipid-binding lipoprotein MlaA [Candidatus Kentron sp. SD]